MAECSEKRGDGFLVGSADFAGNPLMSTKDFFWFFLANLFGNFFLGAVFATFMPQRIVDYFSYGAFTGVRVEDYLTVGYTSAYFYLGSFFSLFLFPAVFLLIGYRRFSSGGPPMDLSRALKTALLFLGISVIVFGIYFSPLRDGNENIYSYAFLMAFPIFPILSVLSSALLAFPAVQLLFFLKLKGKR